MKHLVRITCACAAALAMSAGVAHALDAPAQPDTTGAVLERAPLIGAGTPLDSILAHLEEGGGVRLDVAVVVDPPRSLPAGTYAQIFGVPSDLARQIVEIAIAEGVDPELGFRLVRVESVFRSRARGPQGALGLTQLMPSTARAIDRSVRTEAEILEPATNLRLGFRYLRRMIERFGGDVRLGLLAYNRGEGSVRRALRQGRDPENGYSHRVLGTRGGDPYDGPGLLPAKAR